MKCNEVWRNVTKCNVTKIHVTKYRLTDGAPDFVTAAFGLVLGAALAVSDRPGCFEKLWKARVG